MTSVHAFKVVGFATLMLTAVGRGQPTLRHENSSGGRLHAITVHGAQLTAVGSNGRVLSSTDRVTWTARPTGVVETLTSVASNGSTLVVTTERGRIFHSADGGNWSEVFAGSHALRQIVFLGDIFIAVGDGGTVLRSTDGRTWAPDVSSTQQHLHAVTAASAGSDSVFAIGTAGTWIERSNGEWRARLSGVTSAFTAAVPNYAASWRSSGGVSNGDQLAVLAIGEDARDLLRTRPGGIAYDWTTEPADRASPRPMLVLLANQSVTVATPTPSHPNSWISFPRELLAVDDSGAVYLGSGRVDSAGATARLRRVWEPLFTLARVARGGVWDPARNAWFLVGDYDTIYEVSSARFIPPPTIPAIIGHPADQTAVEGAVVTFSVSATSAGPHIRMVP